MGTRPLALTTATATGTLVDSDHEARQHVEIDIGLVAGLLEQQPQQLGQLVAQLLVVLGENLRGIRVADRVQRVLGRDGSGGP